MAINLLPRNIQSVQKEKNLTLISLSVSFVLLIMLVAVTAVLFSYRYVVTQDYDEVKSRAEVLAEEIKQDERQSIEWRLQNVHSRVDAISKIESGQEPYGDIVKEIDLRMGEEIEMQSIAFDTTDIVVVKGKTNSLHELASFLKVMDLPESGYKDLSVDELRFDEKEYTYQFSLSLRYVGT